MVTFKKLSFLFFIFMLNFLLFADDFYSPVNVSVSIDPYQTTQDMPIPGTVTITHNINTVVDPESFLYDSKPLRVDFVKDVPISSQILSIYNFELPGRPAGLYPLLPMSVKVDGKTYKSMASSFQVSAAQIAKPQGGANTSAFKLTAEVNGPPIIYPGHRIWFVYNFIYSGNIALTKESLPLLDAKGFKIIGDKQIENSQEGNNSIQKVSQQAQAINAGEFDFPASSAEGYAYKDSGSGKQTYLQPKLTAETPALKVVVVPFPTKGKPANFQNAIGEFTIQTSLSSTAPVNVDEKMLLEIDISGEGELSTIQLPDISILKEFFRISSIPALEKIEGNTKRFILEIFPLSTAVKNVPSISFSFFNPILGQYVTVKSQPIPIIMKNGSQVQQPVAVPQVQPSEPTTTELEPTLQPSEQSQEAAPLTPYEDPKVEPGFYSPDIEPFFDKSLDQTKVTSPVKPPPIEIERGQPVTMSDLRNLDFGTWWSLLLMPVGLLIILLQIMLKKKWKREAQIVPLQKSEEVFNQALQAPDLSTFYQLIAKSLILQLFEKGDVPSADIDPEALINEGKSGKVKEFLMEINAERFGESKSSLTQLKSKAKVIFKQ